MNFLIDPNNITKYDCDQPELELLALFWVCAAGKNGVTSARCLDKLLTRWCPPAEKIKKDPTPFDIVRLIGRRADLAAEMRDCGIGCYNNKSQTFRQLSWSGLDLKTCGLEDLEKIKGIGPKTARCFLIHSRRGQRLAGLDTHLLKYLRDLGYAVPRSTPTGKKYRELEQIFLSVADRSGMTVADFDLMIWRRYREMKV